MVNIPTLEEVAESFITDLNNLSKEEWNMIDQSLPKDTDEFDISQSEWLKLHNVQICSIEVGGWHTDFIIPDDWTVDTVREIVQKEEKKSMECYNCKQLVDTFGNYAQCGEAAKNGTCMFVDWWYWNGGSPDQCPLKACEEHKEIKHA